MSIKKEIILSALHVWQYLKYPHLIVAGRTGSGKSYCIYNLLYHMKKQTPNRNIYVMDCKFHELKKIAKTKFDIPNIGDDIDDVVRYIKEVENLMITRQKSENEEHEVIFLILEEYSALKARLDKKKFESVQMSILHIINLGRALNIQLVLSIQRPSSQLLDTDIREQFGVAIGLGEIKGESFKMLFGESKSEYDLRYKDIGEGYIQIGGGDIESYTTPTIKGL